MTCYFPNLARILKVSEGSTTKSFRLFSFHFRQVPHWCRGGYHRRVDGNVWEENRRRDVHEHTYVCVCHFGSNVCTSVTCRPLVSEDVDGRREVWVTEVVGIHTEGSDTGGSGSESRNSNFGYL